MWLVQPAKFQFGIQIELRIRTYSGLVFYRLLKIWLKNEQISINLGTVYLNNKPFANRTSPAQWGSEYLTGLEFECGKLDWMSNGLVICWSITKFHSWGYLLRLTCIKETGELLPDRCTEPYPLKRRAEIGTLRSCSQLLSYIYIAYTVARVLAQPFKNRAWHAPSTILNDEKISFAGTFP